MRKVLFTTKVDEAKTFNSFGAATSFGLEELGEGMFEIAHAGAIRLKVKHPSMKDAMYVKEVC